MKQLWTIGLFAAVVAAVTGVSDSGVLLNFVMMALYAALLAQAWNILGGFGGQFSFGHALFFGTGAYIQAIAQMQGGINPWVALPMAVVGSALVGLFVGGRSATGSKAHTLRWSRWPLPRCSASWRCPCRSPGRAWA
jgi:branched-chain amino acid transport system permease protein